MKNLLGFNLIYAYCHPDHRALESNPSKSFTYFTYICPMNYTIWNDNTAGGMTPLPIVYLHSFRGNGEGPAEGVWKGQAPYKGMAAEHLRWMMEECVPQVEAQFGGKDIMPVIAGYSLAGLFALWAAWNSGYFRRVASVSGSLWYPGFTDYIRNNAPKSGCGEKTGLEKAYFSLGDRESRTRHPLMSRVDVCTAEVVERVRSYGIETTFEWNPGNHFDHPELRMARALAWLLR